VNEKDNDPAAPIVFGAVVSLHAVAVAIAAPTKKRVNFTVHLGKVCLTRRSELIGAGNAGQCRASPASSLTAEGRGPHI
jgi:hypothetical protein